MHLYQYVQVEKVFFMIILQIQIQHDKFENLTET